MSIKIQTLLVIVFALMMSVMQGCCTDREYYEKLHPETGKQLIKHEYKGFIPWSVNKEFHGSAIGK